MDMLPALGPQLLYNHNTSEKQFISVQHTYKYDINEVYDRYH